MQIGYMGERSPLRRSSDQVRRAIRTLTLCSMQNQLARRLQQSDLPNSRHQSELQNRSSLLNHRHRGDRHNNHPHRELQDDRHDLKYRLDLLLNDPHHPHHLPRVRQVVSLKVHQPETRNMTRLCKSWQQVHHPNQSHPRLKRSR